MALEFATIARHVTVTTLALALASSLGCGHKGSGGGGTPGGALLPIDPNRPGDTLYAQALAHFDAGVTAQTTGFADRKAGSVAAAQTDFQTAESEFTQAQQLFDQLRNSATLCGPSPTSVRCDAAAYYSGRCSYEFGVDAIEIVALGGTAATPATTSFQAAVTALDAMQAAFPGSVVLDRAAYFDGRARFHLAQGATPTDTYANALAQFQVSLAANAGGLYADRAQYYVGRCWYELSYKLWAVVPHPAVGSPDYVTASADSANAETELNKVLASYGTSSYVVNAQYYLGKTYYERPFDTTLVVNTQRQANLNTAITWFDQVVAANGLYLGGAHYWRGRCHYALAFELGGMATPQVAQLDLALVDLKQVPPPDVYADNALSYIARCYVHVPVVAPATDPANVYCNTSRAGDAPPAAACLAYANLKALVATPLYSTSTYVTKTQTYIQANSTCVCSPW